MLMDLTLEIQYPIIIFAPSRKFVNRSRLLASYPLGVPFESNFAFPLLRYTAGIEPVAASGSRPKLGSVSTAFFCLCVCASCKHHAI